MRIITIIIFSCLFLVNVKAQTTFSGWVLDEEGNPLIGATVHWTDSSSLGALTDTAAWFELPRPDTVHSHILQIRHASFEPVEVEIFPYENHLRLEVPASFQLSVVEIKRTQRASFNSTLNPINVETLNQGELRRAACCSLAESFENNGTVNVSFSDAVTGAREIEMLGLRGIYTQMMVENRPTLNRMGRAYGLEYIPGTWIESIQVSKGASTVRNGVQGITGQINTELIKPHKSEPFFLNLYAGHYGRGELNTHLAHKFSEKWAIGLLIHTNYLGAHIDHNHDHFLDIPQKQQLNGMWRLVQMSDDLHFEFNIQGIWDDRQGGQTAKAFEKHDMPVPNQLYQIRNTTKRIEAFGKVGYLGFENPAESMALIYNATFHDQTANFGSNNYGGLQRSFYLNLIYQTPLSASREHNLNLGATYQLDDFREYYNFLNLDRQEQRSGIFAEYDFQYQINDKGASFGVIAGMRGDWIQTNNYRKVYPAPRLNLKYNFNENTIIRLSGGHGVRVPNTLIESFRYMPSARQFVLEETILPETAWNYGLNFTQNYSIGTREGSWSLDAFRTDFTNQLIVDIDESPTSVLFYNLNGQSYSNSILLSVTQDIMDGLELRAAYKFNDVRSTFKGTLRWNAFSPQHRGLLALHYITPNEAWQFNMNAQLVGPQRLPDIENPNANLPDYRLNALSPTYVLLNGQITKYFKNGFELYIGGENLGNYRQEAPILGWEDPFQENTASRPLDASAVFAPIMGVMGYAGLRYTFQPKKEKAGLLAEQKLKNAQTITIQTSAQCGMCKTNIEGALNALTGVYSANLDLANKKVTVVYNEKRTNLAAIKSAISMAGYQADEVAADPDAYENLHGCCKLPEDQ